jgi:uncharacterized membrane protein YsdA (DUF1294 family)
MRAGEKRPKKTKRTRGITLVLIALAFLAAVYFSVTFAGMHMYVFYLYLAASALTFVLYAKDKWAAKRGAWRTPEGTLHGLALIGGWPGAMIAQQVFRHKSSKKEFRFMFWAVVLINTAAFIWLLTPEGAATLRSVIASFG